MNLSFIEDHLALIQVLGIAIVGLLWSLSKFWVKDQNAKHFAEILKEKGYVSSIEVERIIAVRLQEYPKIRDVESKYKSLSEAIDRIEKVMTKSMGFVSDRIDRIYELLTSKLL